MKCLYPLPTPIWKFICALFTSFLITASLFAQTSITDFNPASGKPETLVTIRGSNLKPTSGQNINVYFGAVRAALRTVTADSIVVYVPMGATYAPIAVTVNGSTAYTRRAFMPTFDGTDTVLTNASFKFNFYWVMGAGVLKRPLLGDLDSDRFPDLIVPDPNGISLSRNISDHGLISFAVKQHLNAPVAGQLTSADVGDLDGDTRLDIVSTYSQSNVFVAQRNTSIFEAPFSFTTTSVPVNGRPTGVRIRDFDGDGKPDVILLSDDRLAVFRNTTTGSAFSFDSAVSTPVYDSASSLALDDFDGDGRADAAVVNAGTRLISVVRNSSASGMVSFSDRMELTADSTAQTVVSGDVDGDGRPDVIVSTANGVAVFRNTSSVGTISFDAAVSYATAGPAIDVTVCDYNGDGKADLIAASNNVYSVFKNNSSAGSLAFAARTDFSAAVLGGIAAGDLDGDGRPDLIGAATTEPFTSMITIIWNKATKAGQPVLTSITPSMAASGDTVTLKGINFTSAVGVTFGDTLASSFIVVSDTIIKAVVSKHGTGGDVVVATQVGITNLPSSFGWLPKISSFSPTAAKPYDTVTIVGTGLLSSNVRFGNIPALSVIRVSSSELKAVVGIDGFSSTPLVVTVTADNGQSATKDGFTYQYVPVITSFTPTLGTEDATVTINGANFAGVTAVTFGGTPAASFSFQSARLITAKVGSGASGPVTVTTVNGTGSKGGFVFGHNLPLINQISPASAATGTQVTITGKRFTGATAVRFGGVAATSFSVQSDGVILATVGQGASGAVTVVTANGSNQLGGFTYLPPPTITQLNPYAAAAGAQVYIYGKNFTGTTAVYFSGMAASFYVQADSVIRVFVPFNLQGTNITIQVVAPTGTASYNWLGLIPAPVIFSASPQSGGPGTIVTINGANFMPGSSTQVRFNNQPAASFQVVSPNMIIAVVGQGETGPIVVITAGGFFPGSFFNYIPSPLAQGARLAGPQKISSASAVTGDVKVYPNPAAGYTWVEHPAITGSALLQVTDLLGHVIKTAVIAPGTVKTQLSLSGIPNGYYKIVWSDGKAIRSKGIVVAQ
ncbi:T9SS type A sorting domain-containing protein [Chitinophaga agrisoli]|uniref:T9SS type A sorting domain-containing protein n=1 Tax=Chitinophaga agrisoli TaxID=2607653 RepID=A0A5B2VKL8_9BACT|nr:IPT/TIG domain-containing protein [Chitinophaga agrisoli]KAA2239140.1 T9SS type A sorting domain-containing protein [Chitinophaga agrisoli]